MDTANLFASQSMSGGPGATTNTTVDCILDCLEPIDVITDCISNRGDFLARQFSVEDFNGNVLQILDG
jgi:hypothetical protein